ncbi:hypothetical protein FKW77_009976 [Venturia effusa]|uniref:Xylanolytic transcriptional activator regulatory domain-containing protein n=1 Tax=Venturia effusa TaxID=50376 RepID=A0A517L0A6_9PEZI|nr:hypothetical protein FKW77_009976 [Venturia effusa]
MDSTTKTTTPRSIVQFLESKIAELDHQRGHSHTASATSASSIQPTDRVFTHDGVNRVLDDSIPSFLGLSKGVPLARCVIVETGTRVPSAKRFLGALKPTDISDINENHPRSILNPQPITTSLSSVPVDVADFLFELYILRVVPQHPIFYLPDLIAMENKVFHSVSPADKSVTAYEKYTLSLILAIALTTAARTKQAHANSIATGLFKNAMSHASAVLSNDLQGLQALLLLVQYAFLNPGFCNLWLLTGISSQACLDLGLHQELPDHPSVTFLERDMRRRIFWCAWEMEAAVSGGLLRPISMPQRHIRCQFASNIEDRAISSDGLDPTGRPTKFTSHYIWNYRQIECSIISVLFHNEPLPASHPDLESWMSFQEQSIVEWKANIDVAALQNEDTDMQCQFQEMVLYSTIATDYIIVTLFRPCPLNKEPSAGQLLKAFAAAPAVARNYTKQAQAALGWSKYVFHPCHHSFSAAIVFLQALQRYKSEIAALYSWDTIETYMAEFSTFFTMVRERWPQASGCLNEWERLLAPVKKDYLNFLQEKSRRASQVPLEVLASFMDIGPPGGYLEDALNFDVFNPTGSEADDLFGYVPNDWNAEFGFGMQEVPFLS